ncbi:unnamed protein product [Prunus armeniaca]
MDLAVNYLDNLTRVPRFDTLIMFLPSSDNADVVKIWDEVLDNEATTIEYAEKLDNLHTKYCPKRCKAQQNQNTDWLGICYVLHAKGFSSKQKRLEIGG